MKYVVFGKNIKHEWSVDRCIKTIKTGDKSEEVFYAKPKLIYRVKTLSNPKILTFEGEIKYNKGNLLWTNSINIDEDVEVEIEKEIFRADLNEVHLFTNHIISEEGDSEEPDWNVKCEYENAVGDFNSTMIRQDKKMRDYCEAIGILPEKTDCMKLFKLLNEDCDCEIEDGKLVRRLFASEKWNDIYESNLGTISGVTTSAIAELSNKIASLDSRITAF